MQLYFYYTNTHLVHKSTEHHVFKIGQIKNKDKTYYFKALPFNIHYSLKNRIKALKRWCSVCLSSEWVVFGWMTIKIVGTLYSLPSQSTQAVWYRGSPRRSPTGSDLMFLKRVNSLRKVFCVFMFIFFFFFKEIMNKQIDPLMCSLRIYYCSVIMILRRKMWSLVWEKL